MHWFLALALMVPLGGAFGEATAEATPITGGMEVELVVEVSSTTSSIIAHIVVGGVEAQRQVSLDHRGAGVFGGFVELPIQDAAVVFELLAPGRSELSRPTSLSELGVDFSQFSPSVAVIGDGQEPERIPQSARRWLWLAVGAGAAALAILVLWAFPSQTEEDSPSEEASAEPPTSD